jgi:hypothetical protein
LVYPKTDFTLGCKCDRIDSPVHKEMPSPRSVPKSMPPALMPPSQRAGTIVGPGTTVCTDALLVRRCVPWARDSARAEEDEHSDLRPCSRGRCHWGTCTSTGTSQLSARDYHDVKCDDIGGVGMNSCILFRPRSPVTTVL